MRPWLALLLACADPAAPAPAQDSGDPCAVAPTWDGAIAGLLLSHCSGCHAAATVDRHGAPQGASYDTEAQAIAAGPRLRARVLDAQDMPPAGGLHPEEREALGAWLACLE
mgnify:CR=1 FL=1|jgi:uncharacterized membrane protein